MEKRIDEFLDYLILATQLGDITWLSDITEEGDTELNGQYYQLYDINKKSLRSVYFNLEDLSIVIHYYESDGELYRTALSKDILNREKLRSLKFTILFYVIGDKVIREGILSEIDSIMLS